MEMILFGYVIEIIIIWFWYKLIIKKEISLKTNGADRILRRTIKLIILLRPSQPDLQLT